MKTQESPESEERAMDDKKARGLLRDTRGAVLVEFVVALMPMMMTFFGFAEVSKIYAASLGTKHAAITAARAAAVFSNKHDNNPGAEGDGEEQIKSAAGQALAPWIGTGAINKVDVTVTDSSSKSDPYGPVKVKVRATYKCSVPMMGRIICKGGTKVITSEATMPHQGAKYKVGE
jgi:Flp pilus assembly protein TadG